MTPAPVWPLAIRVLHWLSAALVLAGLLLGFTMVWLVHDPAHRFDLTRVHKSIGILVLALTVLRIGRRLLGGAPPPAPAAPPLMALARATHLALYGLLLLMTFSGWLMATTTPVRVPTHILGLIALPYPLAPDFGLYTAAHAVHAWAALVLACLVALHVAAALMHALVWRDGVLARMWGRASAMRRMPSEDARGCRPDAGALPRRLDLVARSRDQKS